MQSETRGLAAESGGQRDFLIIDGMFCAACAAGVEAVLNRHPRVRSASVNFAADAAVLDWSPGAGDRQGLIAAVGNLGYNARLLGEHPETDVQPADVSRGLAARLVVALFFGMWAMLPSVALYFDIVTSPEARFGLAAAAGALSLPVVLYSGQPFYRMGVATLKHGIAGVDVLVLLGVIGSVALSLLALARGSADVYFEVPVALVTLQLIARLLDQRIRRRARDAVVALFDLAPTTMRRIDSAGREHEVALGDVAPGMHVRVLPGERLAVDGSVVDGCSLVDRSLLCGESRPVFVGTTARLHAGERVLDGALTVEVTAAAGKRRIDQLARQVREALAEKPAWQRIADRVAANFLWIASAAALLGTALVLLGGGSPAAAATRALAVFVIACPCALTLAAPLVALSASSAAARQRMILRDLNAVSSAASPDCLFMDKTGTITEGSPTVVDVAPAGGYSVGDVLRVAAIAERDADHPLATAIVCAADTAGLTDVTHPADRGRTTVLPGHGVSWSGPGVEIRVGKVEWLAAGGVDVPAAVPSRLTRVGVAVDGRFVGAIDLEDRIRPGMRATIRKLERSGMRVEILSGDARGPVAHVAEALGIEGTPGLAPEDKASRIRVLQEAGRSVAFVGDGINDAPALAAADLGIAVARSTDAARAAAAVALVDADATALPTLFALTARARRILHQNLAWAVGYNVVAIPAAIAGWVHPAIAAVAMALSGMTIALNALRVRQAGSS